MHERQVAMDQRGEGGFRAGLGVEAKKFRVLWHVDLHHNPRPQKNRTKIPPGSV
jgi:hypothetical protein